MQSVDVVPRDSVELSPGIELNFFSNKFVRHAVQRTTSMDGGGEARRQRRMERQRSMETTGEEDGAKELSSDQPSASPEIPSVSSSPLPSDSDVPHRERLVRAVSFSAKLEDVRSIPARPEGSKKKKKSSSGNGSATPRKKENGTETPIEQIGTPTNRMIDVPVPSIPPAVLSPVRSPLVPLRVPPPIPPTTTRLLFTLGENDFEHDLTNEGDANLPNHVLEKSNTSVSPKIAHLSMEARTSTAHDTQSDISSLNSLPITPQMLGEAHDVTRHGHSAELFQLSDSSIRRTPGSGAWGSMLQQQQPSSSSVFRRIESTTSITSAASSSASSSGGSSTTFGFASPPSPLPSESRDLSPAFGQPTLEASSARMTVGGGLSAMQRRAEAMGALGASLRFGSGSGLSPAAVGGMQQGKSRSLPVSPAAVMTDHQHHQQGGVRQFQPSMLLSHLQGMQQPLSSSSHVSNSSPSPLPPSSPTVPTATLLRLGSGTFSRPLVARSISDPISPPSMTTPQGSSPQPFSFPSPTVSPKLLPASANGSPKLLPLSSPPPDPALAAAQLTLATAHAAHLYHVDLGRASAGNRPPVAVAGMRRSMEFVAPIPATPLATSPQHPAVASASYQEPLLRRGGSRASQIAPVSPPPTHSATLVPIGPASPPPPAATILKQRAIAFPGVDHAAPGSAATADESSLPPRAMDAPSAQNSLMQQNFTRYGWTSPERPPRYINGNKSTAINPGSTRHTHSASMPSEPTSPRNAGVSSSPRHLRHTSGATTAAVARMNSPTHSVHIKSFSFGGSSMPVRYDPANSTTTVPPSPSTTFHSQHSRTASSSTSPATAATSTPTRAKVNQSNIARWSGHDRSPSRAAVADLTAALFIIKNSPSSSSNTNRRKT